MERVHGVPCSSLIFCVVCLLPIPMNSTKPYRPHQQNHLRPSLLQRAVGVRMKIRKWAAIYFSNFSHEPSHTLIVYLIVSITNWKQLVGRFFCLLKESTKERLLAVRERKDGCIQFWLWNLFVSFFTFHEK